MFTAYVMILTIANGNILLKDSRGPYHTEIECKSRIMEMGTSITVDFTKFVTIKEMRVHCAKEDAV